jgi:hypothetical protein
MSDVKQAKSVVERYYELSDAFTDAYFEDVSILEDIPNGSTLVLLPDDDTELTEFGLEQAVRSARNGSDVYIRHFPRCKPAL